MKIYIFFNLILLLFLLPLAMTDNNNNNTESKLPAEVSKKFIPFDERIETIESSIINVPVRCPPSMVKVGKRCRTIF